MVIGVSSKYWKNNLILEKMINIFETRLCVNLQLQNERNVQMPVRGYVEYNRRRNTVINITISSTVLNMQRNQNVYIFCNHHTSRHSNINELPKATLARAILVRTSYSNYHFNIHFTLSLKTQRLDCCRIKQQYYPLKILNAPQT